MSRKVLDRVLKFKEWAENESIDEDLLAEITPVIADYFRFEDISTLGYQVLVFIDKLTGETLGLNTATNKFQSSITGREFYYSSIVSRGYEIHSVVRLSDGVVFTVGEQVECDGIKTIDGLFPDFNGNALWVSIDKLHGYGGGLDSMEAVKPLFQTNDGVDVYPGDKYYYLHNVDNKYSGPYECTSAQSSVIPSVSFSTRDLATKYKESKAVKFNMDDLLFVMNDNPFGMKYTAEDVVELLNNRD